eukprot:TRINITY_DN2125_c0_g1_i1.p1 TRINITY_DN2125_c0_g1~~TRINITY_DN2125_c0_g1_i1.p1  ORF type:complete len:567 (+),score=123.64 TRINITY_DN2125_c0_g1_i1:175-1875(+)
MSSDPVVFGVGLGELMSRPSEKGIPTAVKTLTGHLNRNRALMRKGIFANVDDEDQLARLNDLKAQLNEKERVDVAEWCDGGEDTLLVSSLFRQYLLELPEPLATYKYHGRFMEAAASRDANNQQFTDDISLIVSMLPEDNRLLLEYVLVFLARVAVYEGTNEMGVEQLAERFSSIILRSEDGNGDADLEEWLAKFMIEKCDRLFRTGSQGTATSPRHNRNIELKQKRQILQTKISRLKTALGEESAKALESENPDDTLRFLRRLRHLRRAVQLAEREAFDSLRQESVALRWTSGMASEQGRRKAMEDTHAVFDDLTEVEGFPMDSLVSTVGRASSSPSNSTSSSPLPSAPSTSSSSPPQTRNRNGARESVEEDQILRCGYFGVYDGHSGAEAAAVVGDVLHRHIIGRPEFSERDGNVEEALLAAFASADEFVLAEGVANKWTSGSTAVVGLLRGTELFVANCGDSELIVGQRVGPSKSLHVPVVLSQKHSPKEELEKKRIEDLGGNIFGGRIFGTLAVSRSFGDSDYKKPTSEADYVSAVPAVTSFTLREGKHDYIVVACDGLFEK